MGLGRVRVKGEPAIVLERASEMPRKDTSAVTLLITPEGGEVQELGLRVNPRLPQQKRERDRTKTRVL